MLVVRLNLLHLVLKNNFMKSLLFITTLLVGLSACNMADDGDYEGMASDMCGCFNDATAGLSDEARKIVEDAGKNDENAQDALMGYIENNPIEGMKDIEVLAGLEESDFMACLSELEKKYDDVYTTETEAEVQDKLIEVMKDVDGCALTYAFVKAGM